MTECLPFARHCVWQWVCSRTLKKLWSSHGVTNCFTLPMAFSAETGGRPRQTKMSWSPRLVTVVGRGCFSWDLVMTRCWLEEKESLQTIYSMRCLLFTTCELEDTEFYREKTPT